MADSLPTGQPVRVPLLSSTLNRLQRPSTVVWTFRLLWASLAVLSPAMAYSLLGTSSLVRAVGVVGLWAGWAVVLTASLVPTTISLTVVRLLTPGALVASIAGVVRQGATATSVVGLAMALAAGGLAYAAEFALVFVQGSAYGDETRFPLRPPGPLAVGPLPIGWLFVFGTTIAGPLLLAAKAWIPGAILTMPTVALAVVFSQRCHRLARRYLVLVPAGLVLHDHLVLADTVMLPKSDIASLGLAETSTEAADLTGKALGNALEITLKDFETVVFAATRSAPGGTAIHAKGLLVSPSRPGSVLEEARRRGLSVRLSPTTPFQ